MIPKTLNYPEALRNMVRWPWSHDNMNTHHDPMTTHQTHPKHNLFIVVPKVCMCVYRIGERSSSQEERFSEGSEKIWPGAKSEYATHFIYSVQYWNLVSDLFVYVCCVCLCPLIGSVSRLSPSNSRGDFQAARLQYSKAVIEYVCVYTVCVKRWVKFFVFIIKILETIDTIPITIQLLSCYPKNSLNVLNLEFVHGYHPNNHELLQIAKKHFDKECFIIGWLIWQHVYS